MLTDTQNDISSDRLITLVASGDKDAGKLLYERFSHKVYLFALSLSGSAASAEDIMQDAFVNILSYTKSYRESSNPAAWIFTVTRHCFISSLKKQSPRQCTEP